MTEQAMIQPYRGRDEADPQLRKCAMERLEAGANFKRHLSSYVVMSGMLVAVWLFSGAEYFWPMWPMLGWGIALAWHAVSLRNCGPTEAQISAEAAKLCGPAGHPGPQDRR
ncbi:hypothetical protein BJY21_000841 [Kineosphaera limosa]|uniref:2TM domain-containing protein n=1 Tax=Kineosphaera limosa NBRC 100340 TaxID=1184609 RepID=K6WP59_9MICO|nr:2TM domain-containing protein [Kineosphaera limosa]NYD99656.1 hypothetical protein [Kineosphaera limosa]GAB95611.1 hypothetical protein KILIM_024_00210 [Kineosphaera limosa NBRC 100340]